MLKNVRNIIWINYTNKFKVGKEQIYEIDTTTSQTLDKLNRNLRKITQILLEIWRMNNSSHVYRVDVNTTDMVKKISNHVHIMHDGKIVENGPVETIFDKPRNPYTIHLLNSIPKGEPEQKPNRKLLLEIAGLQCHFPIKAGFFRRTIGKIKAVDGVNLTIHEGTTYGVVGESGSGTILRRPV